MKLFGFFKRLINRPVSSGGRVAAENPGSFSSLSFRRVLRNFDYRSKEFFFLQIGAFDGTTNDPLAQYVRKYGWSGIMLEPQKRYFQMLMDRYAQNSRLQILNLALSETDGKRTLYYVRADRAGLPDWAAQLASFSREVILNHRQYIPDVETLIASEEVDCISFDSLLNQYDVGTLDLLHIDTEGYDYEIIKMIPWERITPGIIVYEHKHLTTVDRDECLRFLIQKGYRISIREQDSVAYQERCGKN